MSRIKFPPPPPVGYDAGAHRRLLTGSIIPRIDNIRNDAHNAGWPDNNTATLLVTSAVKIAVAALGNEETARLLIATAVSLIDEAKAKQLILRAAARQKPLDSEKMSFDATSTASESRRQRSEVP